MLTVICNPEYCLGCKSCEIACAIEHSPEKNLISAVLSKTKPRIDVVYAGISVPVSCNHCEDAPCVKVCPTSAIKKYENKILIDDKLCIGCKSCVIVCPFGAISFDGIAYKCDLCNERNYPACVEACPTGALKYTDIEDFVKSKKIRYAKNLNL